MNLLYYGDNLGVLRGHVEDESVDLVYLDPPFNSKANYNVLFKEHTGKLSHAQITAFEDTWKWGIEAEESYTDVIQNGPQRVAELMEAYRLFLKTSDMMAYLAMMAPRLVELHRVLRPHGSLYLHCDTTASHYIKLVLDAIFDPKKFQNEIVWKRTTAHNDPHRFGRIGDRLLFYAKGEPKTFNVVEGSFSKEQLKRYKYQDDGGPFRAENLTAPHYSETRTVEWRGVHPGKNRQWRFGVDELEQLYEDGRILLQKDGRPRKDGLKEYLADAGSPALQDIWTDISLSPTSAERLNYPTQKPEALLDRIIRASSKPGDVVLDPFCGCGTTVSVAEQLNRRWIGIDITHLAISLMRHRLKKTMGAQLSPYEVFGEPTDKAGAEALAQLDRYQFQYWAIGLVDAQAVQDKAQQKKKGADGGIDGYIKFFDSKDGKPATLIVQVKSGHVSVKDVRELIAVVAQQKAVIGVLITLEPTTKPMRDEALSEGFFVSKVTGQSYPKIQLLSVDDLLAGKRAAYPMTDATFKAAKMKGKKQDQLKLI